MLDHLDSNDRQNSDSSSFKEPSDKIFEEFMAIPLENYHKTEKPNYKEVLDKILSIF